MAIVWGNTSGQFRLGIETTVANGAMSIVVYGQTFFAHRWTGTLYFSGDWAGSKQITVSTENYRTETFELHRSSARFTGTRRYGASVSYWNGSASVSTTVTISPTVKHPAAPTNVRITGGNGNRVNLAWTNAEKYDHIRINRRAWYKGSREFSLDKIVSGETMTTSIDLPDGGFDSYQWKLVGSRGGLGSAYSNATAWYYTAPDIVTGVRVERSGDNAVVSWDDTGIKELVFEVYRDGVRVGQTTQGAEPVSSYTDTNVASGIYTYTVRAGVKNWDGTITWGPRSAPSNKLFTVVPPHAPVGLTPDGTYIGANAFTRFSWQHNPADASRQTSAEVTFTPRGGAADKVLATTSQHVSKRLSVGEWVWTVRTKGAHPDYGPLARATVTVIALPTATLQAPTTPGQYNSRTLTIQWAYSHENPTHTQTGWEARLRQGEQVLEEISGTGQQNHATFTTELVDKTSYQVELVVSTRGVKSLPVRMDVTTFFRPPADPEITVSWDDTVGAARIEVRATASDVASQKLAVYASDDEGRTWRKIGETSGEVFNVSDYKAKSAGTTIYRAESYAASGASSQALFTLTTRSGAVWISTGPDFGQTLRLPYDPEVTVSMQRHRSRLVFEGRTLPVAYADSLAWRTVKTGGRIWEPADENSTLTELRRISQHPHPVHLYRDPAGNQVFGTLTSLTIERETDQLWKWDAALEETEIGRIDE